MHRVELSLKLLLLLAAANTAPLLAKRCLGGRWATPLDGGLRWFDGRPWLGPSKTLRGLMAAMAATTFAAPMLGLPATTGALIGVGAMLGDALSSFVKRRLGTQPSERFTGLDQVPEALLPLLMVQSTLGLSLAQVAAITLVFFVLEIPLAWLFHRLGWRDQPY